MSDATPPPDAPLDELLTACHERLAATAERPAAREASARLGEAEAVAADLAAGAPEAVVAERIEHVQRLLGEIETTGDEEADAHLAAAVRLAERIDQRAEE